jgi:DNA-binding beta-propeller fold protein YncE
MKILRYLVILSAALFVFSCVKKESTYEVSEVNGIRITQNTGVPADSTLAITVKEVTVIEMINEEEPEKTIRQLTSMDVDSEGNIYILDAPKARISKFDSSGSFIKSFGTSGQGPGEFQRPQHLIISSDTIIVSDFGTWKLVKFDLEGKYSGEKQFADYYQFPAKPEVFGDGYISFSQFMRADDTGQRISVISLGLYDENFEHIKDIYQAESVIDLGVEYDATSFGIKHRISNNELYVSENSKTEYSIDVYNLKGERIRQIRKNHIRVKAPQELIDKQKEMNEKRGTKFLTEYNNAISSITSDKYNRLWVGSEQQEKEEGVWYDIFENDVFLDRVKIDLGERFFPYYISDRIIALNYQTNTIKIYEY